MTRILLVEDSPTQAAQIAGVLRQEGFEVVQAGDGLEAARLVKEQPPDVVLTDLQMPEINGLQLVTALGEDFPSVPIVLMTAHGSEEMAVEALRRGAAGYVPKSALPFTIAETLLNVLEVAKAERDRERVQQYVSHLETGFDLDNDPSLIPPLVAHLEEELCALWSCRKPQVFRQMVALREALRNAIFHGNLEVPEDVRNDGEVATRVFAEQRCKEPPYAERRLFLKARFMRDAAEYTVTDEGAGFDVSSLSADDGSADLDQPGPRGLILIRNFMDEVRHNERGNEITMIKARESSPVRSGRES